MGTLRAEHITKDYPGTRALDDVTVSFESGKINALLGKNGSGKSTLCKLFAAVESATSGEMYYDEEHLNYKDPRIAAENGIVMVYQETSLVPTMTVAENIFMGRLPLKSNGLVDWKQVKSRSRELLDRMGLNVGLDQLISHLPMWQRQVIEICKALAMNPKVLILDEPTSALAKTEVEKLFEAVRKIKENDVVIIYISHKLQEIHEIADTVTVLRDGKYIGQKPIEELNNAAIIQMMFGDVEIRKRPEGLETSTDVIMSVRGLTKDGWFKDINFDLYKGEVLGLAGMLGSGRTELLGSVFGSMPYDSGDVIVDGVTYKHRTPSKMKDAGVGLTPEDRKTTGLVLMHSIESNLCYASMKKTTTNGWVESKQKRKEMAQKQVDFLQIKISGIEAKASSLSGGNQQKVVVGNWLNNDPKIMLYDEPTRGIDVNAKQQIFEIMWQQAALGNSCIFVSTEIEELLDVCHRILVIHGGKITHELTSKDLETTTVNDLYTLCMEE